MIKILRNKEWEVLNYNTKKAQQLINEYDNSNYYCMKDAYPSGGSWAKNDIWNGWKDYFKENGFYNYKIVSKSHWYFSIGALICINDKIYQVHVTASHWYIIERKNK